MFNLNYEVYKDIMSVKPIIRNDYISDILHLAKNQVISDIDVTEVIESNTALIIKVSIKIKCDDVINAKKLFIKTIKSNKSENAYQKMSLKEGKFYQLIKDMSIDNMPLPACYDAFVSDEKGEFVIVLEDTSNQYTVPSDSILTDKNIWFSCAESLAKFHSVFWNHKVISQNNNNVTYDAQSDRECLQSFLHDFKDNFSSKVKTTFENAMEINISHVNEKSRRICEKNNVTVCNGDSHIYNFMLPVNQNNIPLIVDFQFWGGGIGISDLAHLTRVGFSDELKKDIQIQLVEHYYKSLLENGVTGYSWENCFTDYRTSVASMVLIPLWQYAGFGLKYEEWINDLNGLIYNYEYLECDELYRN